MEWTYSSFIQAPARDVFRAITDPMLIPQWEDGVLELRPVSAPPLRLGSTFLETRTTLGKRMDIFLQVIAFQTDRVFGVEALGGSLEFKGTRYLSEVHGGTRIWESSSAKLPRVIELFGPLMPKLMDKANNASCARLAELVKRSARPTVEIRIDGVGELS
jgi:hypothetical protein